MCNVMTTWRMFRGAVRGNVGAGQQGDQEEEDLLPGTWFEFTGAVATQRSHNHTKFIFIMLFSLPLAAPCKVLSVASCCVLRETE